MKTYARIHEGVVAEIIRPITYDDGSEIPIEVRFEPGFVSSLVNITDEDPMPSDWWLYDGEKFSPFEI
ncbi:hypothetical protein [Achromobacter ruhlandii]|uniref:hypothetical protein n=1 Tax=Achromobacter ruhlandii TaxID=72557 RepID=UPI0007BFBFFC|nr:hypothetical protein [Achromobacter ruhlandii]